MSILYNFTSVIEETPLPVLTVGTDNLGNGMYRLRAGTPLGLVEVESDDENADPVYEWEVANTGDACAVAAEDYVFITTDPIQPKLVKLVKKGYIDLAAAEASSGLEYSQAAINALNANDIICVDNVLRFPTPLPIYETYVELDEGVYVLDTTFNDIAFNAEHKVIIARTQEAGQGFLYLMGFSPNPGATAETYTVMFSSGNTVLTFKAPSATAPLVLQNE